MGHSLRAEVADTGIRVTLIEPGAVDTPFFDNTPESSLEADDVARAVMYALSQPASVEINELLIRPVRQST
jgi:NADP-dependent 3-hydroxy acid dehydrogenase YdfG